MNVDDGRQQSTPAACRKRWKDNRKVRACIYICVCVIIGGWEKKKRIAIAIVVNIIVVVVVVVAWPETLVATGRTAQCLDDENKYSI